MKTIRKSFRFSPEDESLLSQAKALLGSHNDSETVRRALLAVIRPSTPVVQTTVPLNVHTEDEEEPSFKLISTVWDGESGEMVKTIKRTTKPWDVKFIKESDPEYAKYV